MTIQAEKGKFWNCTAFSLIILVHFMDRPLSPDKRRRKCPWNWIQSPAVAWLFYYVFDKLLYLFGCLYSWFDHVQWRYRKARIHLMALCSNNLPKTTNERHHKRSYGSYWSWELEVFWEIVMAIVMFDPLGSFSDSSELESDWLMKTRLEYVLAWQFSQVSLLLVGMKRRKSSGSLSILKKCQKPLHVTGLFLNQNWMN